MAEIRPDNVIRVPVGNSLDRLLRMWLEFLHPFHGLANREMDVAAAFLRKRYELYRDIPNNDELRNNILMNNETQREIMGRCGLKTQHFQVIKNKLKKNRFFVDGKINPRLVPNIKGEGQHFQLLLFFEADGGKE